MNAKQPYRTPEGDMCDLDPNKICDNCMKCVNKNGADYTEILADFDPESIRVFTPGDDEDDISEPIEQLDIDPELMAEWEEKLRLAVTTHNSCQNGHIHQNTPGKPELSKVLPR